MSRILGAIQSKRFKLPQEEWIAKKIKAPRWSPHWRPFQGGLSASSQTAALTILNLLMQWLDDCGYLKENPFDGLLKALDPNPAMHTLQADRSFTHVEWQALCVYLKGLESTTEDDWKSRVERDKYDRLRFAFSLAYGTGLRLNEMANLRRHHFIAKSNDGHTSWNMRFQGKNGHQRKVSISNNLMQQIDAYFVRRGHAAFLEAPSEAPLIARLPRYDRHTKELVSGTTDIPVSIHQVAQVFKGFFKKAATHLADTNPAMARIIRSASTHWLRHTYANHSLDLGLDLITVHRNLGNRLITSTQTYEEYVRSRASIEAENYGPVF